MKENLNFRAIHIDKFLNQHRKLLTALFTVLFTILLAGSANSQTSSYAGQYKGEWVGRPAGLGFFDDGESEHEGTWNISIDSDGEITGTGTDDTAGSKCTIKGFVDEKGAVNISIKYTNTTKVKGVFEKNGVRLLGRLKQYCDGSVCATLEMTLKKN